MDISWGEYSYCHMHHECMCIILTNRCSSFNGILEMDGFQDTFSDVYSRDRNNIVLYYGNGSYNLISDNGNQTCSSGNGAEADIMIVSLQLP